MRDAGIHATTANLPTSTENTIPLIQINGAETQVEPLGKASRVRHDGDRQPQSEPPFDKVQIGLPSTIADSVNSRMQAAGTQSQGDTQPASPWLYEKIAAENRDQDLQGSQKGVDVEGNDSGHIDLLAAFETQKASGQAHQLIDHNNEDDADLISQDIHAEIFPESQRFCPPKTPLAQGTKRKRDCEESARRTETPRLPVNVFANSGNTRDFMRQSQLFEATQAITSPSLLQSEITSDRPSPNFGQIARPSTAESRPSPAILPRRNVARSFIEPRAVYISMQESQEQRERLLKMQQVPEELSSDEEFLSSSPPRKPLVRVSSPRPLNTRKVLSSPDQYYRAIKIYDVPTSSRPPERSPCRSGKSVNNAMMISDDVSNDENHANTTEEETDREEDDDRKRHNDNGDEFAEDNKENIEVPMTVSKFQSKAVNELSSQVTPLRKHPEGMRGGAGKALETGIQESSPTNESEEQNAALGRSSQSYAIRDSQSSQRYGGHQMLAASSPAVPSGPQSSLDSRNVILQSQLSQTSKSPVSARDISEPALVAKGVLNVSKGTREHRTAKPSHLALEEFSEDELSQADLQVGRRASASTQTKTSTLGSGGSPTKTAGPDLKYHSQPLSISCLERATILETLVTAQSEFTGQEANTRLSSSAPLTSTLSSHLHNHKSQLAGQASTTTSLPFETAPESLDTSQAKVVSQRKAQDSARDSLSPQKPRSRRTLGDIAGDLSPAGKVDSLDVEIDILTADDIDFQSAINGEISRDSLPVKEASHHSRSFKPVFTPGSTPERPGSAEYSPISSFFPSSAIQDKLSSPPSRHGAMDHTTEREGLAAPSSPYEQNKTQSSQHGDTLEPKAKAPSSEEGGHVDGERMDVDRNPEAHDIDDEHDADESPAFDSLFDESARRPAVDQLLQNSSELDVAMGAAVNVEDLANNDNDHRQDEATLASENRDRPIVAPQRVLAHFNGLYSAYHAATCIGVVPGEEPRFNIRFDDGATDTVNAYGVKRLELRPGDMVKLDQPGQRAKIFVVIDMKDFTKVVGGNSANAYPQVDIFGYSKAVLAPKIIGTPNGTALGGHIEAKLDDIYITQTLWGHLKDRDFCYGPVQLVSTAGDGLRTPSERPSTPSSPASRSRRLKNAAKGLPSIPLSLPTVKEGIFKYMSFATTNLSDVNKEKTKNLILSHGGVFLTDGFSSLFNSPNIGGKMDSNAQDSEFYLLPPAIAGRGFTALIVDDYCRSAKYMQALALGIPCLATRWIVNCVAKNRVLPWSPYLVAAGVSTFLAPEGLTRSRILPSTFPPETTSLADMIDNRPQFFQGQSVLMVVRKGSDEIDMEFYSFLLFALGTARAERVSTIDAAIRKVATAKAQNNPFDWVITPDGEDEIRQAALRSSASNSRTQAEGSRKRERKSKRSSIISTGEEVSTKVVGKEFLIQSLILGQLIDE